MTKPSPIDIDGDIGDNILNVIHASVQASMIALKAAVDIYHSY